MQQAAGLCTAAAPKRMRYIRLTRLEVEAGCPAPSSRYIHTLAFVDGRGCGCCHWATHEPETRILFTLSAKGGSTNSLGVPSDFGSVPIFCFLVIGTHTFPQHVAAAPARCAVLFTVCHACLLLILLLCALALALPTRAVFNSRRL